MDRSDSKHGRRVDWILIGILLTFAAASTLGRSIEPPSLPVTASASCGMPGSSNLGRGGKFYAKIRIRPVIRLLILAVSVPVRHSLFGHRQRANATQPQLANASPECCWSFRCTCWAGPYLIAAWGSGRRFYSSACQWPPVPWRMRSTEGTYLLFLAIALLFAVEAIRPGSVVGFGLSGLFGGLRI